MTQYKKAPLRSSGPFGVPIPCKICGEKSNGVHYGVLTCEGCKSFFKRELAKTTRKIYLCFRGDACYAAEKAKGRCRACRYKKCLKEGMSSHRFSQGALSKTAGEKMASQLPSGVFGTIFQNHGPELSEKGDEKHHDGHSENKQTSILLSSSSADGSTMHSDTPMGPSFTRSTVLVDGRTQLPLKGILEKSLAESSQHGYAKGASPAWRPDIHQSNWVPGHAEARDLVTKSDLDQLDNCPTNLRDYFHAILMQNRCLKDTVRAVMDASEMANRERRSRWMEHGLHCHVTEISSAKDTTFQCSFEDKNQTRIPTETLRKVLRFEFQLGVNWSRDFICGLPGLTELNATDLTRLLVDRAFQFFVINMASLFTGDQALTCDTSRRMHSSSQLSDLLSNRDWPEFLEVVTVELGQLHLSHTERYLLLIILLLDPATAPEEIKQLFIFLHTLYLDAFLQLMEHNRVGMNPSLVFPRLRKLVRRFAHVAEIGRAYFAALNFDTVPHDKDFYAHHKSGKMPDGTNIFLFHWTRGDVRNDASY